MAEEVPERESPAELVAAVGSLIEMMRSGGITELDLTFGGTAIRLRGNGGSLPLAPVHDARPAEAAPEPSSPKPGHVITAPMIGTFYGSPAPGDPPFVQVGDRVEVGQVIGIIEAMKIMNEIAADRSGTVTEILVANAQAVEYGTPLIRLIDDGAGA